VRAALKGKISFCRRARGITVILIACAALAVTGGIFIWDMVRADEKKNTGRDTTGNTENQEELVIYSSHPIDFMRPLIEEFEPRTGIQVSVETGGSGEMLDQVETERAAPKADILWGGSLSTLKPQSYLFENYKSVNEDMVQEKFRNTEGTLTRFSNIPSILLVNEDLIGNVKITGYEDVLNPNHKGKIVLEHVTKRRGKYYAVDDLSLVIEDNAFVTLLVPSGCGKTTTLRMIAGLETPTSGKITIGGVTVFDSEMGINIPANKRHVGFLFHNYALWPNMTVYQNISFGLANRKEEMPVVDFEARKIDDLIRAVKKPEEWKKILTECVDKAGKLDRNKAAIRLIDAFEVSMDTAKRMLKYEIDKMRD